MPDIFPESRDEAILLSMINGEEYTGFPESRIEVLLLQLKATLEDWKSKTKGAYVFHGSVEFSELPSTLTEDMVGWTYNMSEGFTTDDRFVDGAGKVYPAGTNVAIANVGTDETPVLKFDVTSAFVDVNAIYNAIDNIANMIADEFDEDEAYAVGDIVWYVDDLYTFVSPHTAGNPWSNLEVNMTTVDEIINAVYADINNTISDIEDMIANQFNAATAYSEGDYVIYQNGLYKFTSDHAVGAAWDPSIVSSIDVTAAIKQAESDFATLSEYFAAMTNIVSDLENQVDTIQEALTKTASGNPVVIDDCAGGKARSLKTTIEAIQDLHGYDHPWVGGAGKNKLPMTVAGIKAANIAGTWTGNVYAINNGTIEILTDDADNVTGIKINGTLSDLVIFRIVTSLTLPSGTYTFSGLSGGSTSNGYWFELSGAGNGNDHYITNPDTFALTNATYSSIYFACRGGVTLNNQIFCFQLEEGSQATDFAPYSNICPISGRTEARVDTTGRNIWDEEVELGGINSNGEYNDLTDRIRTKNFFPFVAGTTYFCSIERFTRFACYDSNHNFVGLATYQASTIPSTDGSGHGYYLTPVSGSVYGKVAWSPNYGTTYNHNICINISDASFNGQYVPYAHSSATIQLGTTVYGADINWDTGVATVDRAYVKAKDLTWSTQLSAYARFATVSLNDTIKKSDTDYVCISDIYESRSNQDSLANYNQIYANASGYIKIGDVEYASSTVEQWLAARGETEIVYKLATPTTIQLTPTQLQMLKGYNRVSIESGTIELGYSANVQTEVDVLETTKADNADVVDYIENGNTASRAYTANQFMLWKGDLYKVTTSIASGATITAGTNVSKTTIGAVLTAILNS